MLFSTAKKLIIFLIGGSVVAIGSVMLILPGPAFIVIPIGLAILGTEFAWAKAFLKRLQSHAVGIRTKLTKTPKEDNSQK
jgi:tellurite resistance protein TerC